MGQVANRQADCQSACYFALRRSMGNPSPGETRLGIGHDDLPPAPHSTAIVTVFEVTPAPEITTGAAVAAANPAGTCTFT